MLVRSRISEPKSTALGRSLEGRKTLRYLAAVGAVVASLLLTQIAAAAPVAIDSTNLTGPGPSTWEPRNNPLRIDANPCEADLGYSAVLDGNFDGMPDAFDGGGMLKVGGTTFKDGDGQGDLVGQSLSTGPVKAGNLRVSRTDTALATSPTLRSVIGLRNPTNSSVSTTVIWDNGLGSDGAEAVRASSDGNKSFTAADRWVVSSDSATAPHDPPVTAALFGKQGAVTANAVLDAPGGTGCITVSFRVSVPAGSTRYLMLFLEMHSTNDKAARSAGKFNDRNLSSDLLSGISSKIKQRILNWNV